MGGAKGERGRGCQVVNIPDSERSGARKGTRSSETTEGGVGSGVKGRSRGRGFGFCSGQAQRKRLNVSRFSPLCRVDKHFGFSLFFSASSQN